jgi:hypothetical protein
LVADGEGEGDGEDVIFSGFSFSIRAIRRANGRMPAIEWFDGLDKKAKVKVLATAANVDKYMDRGRPTNAVLDFVKGSHNRLVEFRATRKGARPPHLRLLGLLEGRTFWAATGFKKGKNDLLDTDINKAERIAADWKKRGAPK